MKKVIFANRRQKIIFETVMLPEIMEGRWANAKPYNHRQTIEGIKCSFNANQKKQGTFGFKSVMKYDFPKKEFLHDRAPEIIRLVKFFMVLKDYPLEFKKDAMYYDKVILGVPSKELDTIIENLDEINKKLVSYGIKEIAEGWLSGKKKVIDRMNKLNVTNKDLDRISAFKYDASDLRKDLIEMMLIWRKGYHESREEKPHTGGKKTTQRKAVKKTVKK